MNSLYQISEIWFDVFPVHILEISLFISLVWLIDSVFRLGTTTRYTLWLIAGLKCLVPPFFSLPEGIEQNMASIQFLSLLQVGIPIEITRGTTVWSLSVVLFLAWLILSLMTALFLIIQNNRFRKFLQNAKSISLPGVVPSRIRIFESDNIASPLLIGILKPRLYLPPQWRLWESEELQGVISHELNHYERRDSWVLFLQYILLILFGFNPLIWLVHHRLNFLREIRCDEHAIEKTGLTPVDYSRLLYGFVEQQTFPSVLFFGKTASKAGKSVQNRIRHILNFKEAAMKKKMMTLIGVPAAMLLLIVPFSWKCAGQSTSPGSESFVKFDTPPSPVGGFKAIQENLVYSESAKEAGAEGRVILRLLISETGEVKDSRVLHVDSLLTGHGYEEMALNAVKSVDWQPAKQGATPVEVWVAIPIVFRKNPK